MKSVSILALVLTLVGAVWQHALAANCPVSAKFFFLNSMGTKNGSALYQVTVEAAKPLKASIVLDLFVSSNQKVGTVQSREVEFTNSHSMYVLLPPRQVMLSFVWPLANITSVKVANVRDATESPSCESMPVSLNPVGVVQGIWQFDDTAQREEIAMADIISPIRRMNDVYPEYPLYAKEQNQQGTVLVAATVGGSGTTLATWVYQSSGVEPLDDSALRAARKMTFSPARSSIGEPTIATIIIEFVFTLD